MAAWHHPAPWCVLGLSWLSAWGSTNCLLDDSPSLGLGLRACLPHRALQASPTTPASRLPHLSHLVRISQHALASAVHPFCLFLEPRCGPRKLTNLTGWQNLTGWLAMVEIPYPVLTHHGVGVTPWA